MVFTGFDSAWGARQTGALCDIAPSPDGNGYVIQRVQTQLSWANALKAFSEYDLKSHVISIDQPLVVPNQAGMRPVERKLARALMRDFKCGAHAANTSNLSCFGPDAGIWKLVRLLHERGYIQSPNSVAEKESGRFFFECYPHPALLGLFDLKRTIAYKVRHRKLESWRDLLQLLSTLSESPVPVRNVAEFFPASMPHQKANEDALDSFVAAYVAAWLFEFGYERSMILGDLVSGYIVTPVSSNTRRVLEAEFLASARNPTGSAPASLQPASGGATAPKATPTRVPDFACSPDRPSAPGEPQTLTITDTSNLWGNCNPWLTRFDCELLVEFSEVEGSPVVRFVPFAKDGAVQRGVAPGGSESDRASWCELTLGASKANPTTHNVLVTWRFPKP